MTAADVDNIEGLHYFAPVLDSVGDIYYEVFKDNVPTIDFIEEFLGRSPIRYEYDDLTKKVEILLTAELGSGNYTIIYVTSNHLPNWDVS